MRRAELVRKIARAAAVVDKEMILLREGGSHSVFRCGSQSVVIPRHREINELTARRIMRDLDGELGEGWWK
jgi:mRNA interferase HicA